MEDFTSGPCEAETQDHHIGSLVLLGNLVLIGSILLGLFFLHVALASGVEAYWLTEVIQRTFVQSIPTKFPQYVGWPIMIKLSFAGRKNQRTVAN